jgi:hypothetical protein
MLFVVSYKRQFYHPHHYILLFVWQRIFQPNCHFTKLNGSVGQSLTDDETRIMFQISSLKPLRYLSKPVMFPKKFFFYIE